MEPISIAIASLEVSKLCWSVGSELMKFCHGVKIADTAVSSLHEEIEALKNTIEPIKGMVDSPKIKTSIVQSDDIEALWSRLKTALDDVQRTLISLQTLVSSRVDKEAGVLEATRKHLRLKSNSSEIQLYRQRIRVFKDTIHLSLQCITVHQQASTQDISDKVIRALDEIPRMIRQLEGALDKGIQTERKDIDGENKGKDGESSKDAEQEDFKSIQNLKDCLDTSQTVFSDAETIVETHTSSGYVPQLRGALPRKVSQRTRSWVDVHTVEQPQDSKSKARISPPSNYLPPPGIAEGTAFYDSDDELEMEVADELLRLGIQNSEVDPSRAESCLRDCIGKVTGDGTSAKQNALRLEAMSALSKVLTKQQKWDDAEDLMRQKISILETNGSKIADVMLDRLTLTEILLNQGSSGEAVTVAKICEKQSRKMGVSGQELRRRSLCLLERACSEDGRPNDAEAYSRILQKDLSSTSVETKEVHTPPTEPPMPSERRISSPISTHSSVQGSFQQQLLLHKIRVKPLRSAEQLHFSADGKSILAVEKNCAITTIDVLTGQSRNTLPALPKKDFKLATVGQNDSTVALLQAPGMKGMFRNSSSIELWDTTTGNQLPGENGTIKAKFCVDHICFHQAGSILLAAGDRKVHGFGTSPESTRKPIITNEVNEDISSLASSPTGTAYAIAIKNSSIAYIVGKKVSVARCDELFSIKSLAFSHDGRTLAVAGDTLGKSIQSRFGPIIQLRDAHSGAHLRNLTIRSEQCRRVWLDVRLDDQVAREPRDAQLTSEKFPHSTEGHWLAFSPTENLLALLVKYRAMTHFSVWNADTGAELQSVVMHSKNAGGMGLAFAPDGKRLVMGSAENSGRLWVWDVESLRQEADVFEAICGFRRVNSKAFAEPVELPA